MTRAWTLVGYAVALSAAMALQVAGLVGRRVPTAGEFMRWFTRLRAARWLLLAGWLWLGWHLFARAEHG